MSDLPREFIVFEHEDSATEVFLNLSQIRMVTFKADGSCTVVFSELHTVKFDGIGSVGLLRLLGDRAIGLDGKPVVLPEDFTVEELIRKASSVSPPSSD